MLKKIVNNLAIIEIILFAGSVAFNVANERAKWSMMIFGVTSIFCFFLNKSSSKIIYNNLLYPLFIMFWVFINVFFINPGNYFLWLIYPIYSIGSCLIMSSLDFHYFRIRILKYFNILMFISIIIYFLEDIIQLPTIYVPVNNTIQSMIFGLFKSSQMGAERRLASIYWEPGQLQIVIFYILCLFSNILYKFSIKDLFKNFGLLFIALLLTKSTTGYLVFIMYIMFILLSRLQYYKSIYSKIMMFPIFLIIGILIFNSLYMSDSVQNKLNQRHYSETYSSFNERYNDNKALLMMSMEKPLFGYGVESESYYQRAQELDNNTNSNGWLKLSAMLGFPYLLFLIFRMFKIVKKRSSSWQECIIIMIILLFSQANESSVFYPYLYMYIFSFPQYYNKI